MNLITRFRTMTPPQSAGQRQAGLSLIEMMIAITISMVIMLALGTLLFQISSSRKTLEKDARKIESGRYAVESVSDDIQLAGFYGEYLPQSPTWSTPNPCETTLASLGWSTTTSPVSVPVAVFGYEFHNSTAALPTSLATCLPNYKSNTDILVIRRTSTTSLAPASITAGEVYLQVSTCADTTLDLASKPFVLGNASADFTLHNLKCGTNLAKVRKYMVHVYYVSTCNNCGSDTIPTLKRVDLQKSGGSLAMSTPMAISEGIEDIHFEYGIDEAGNDGSPDKYYLSNSDPLTTAPSPAFSWQNVMSVKASVIARDLETTAGYSDNKSFQLGTVTISAANDTYKRHAFTSTARVTNASGRRETP